jgi:hypothetical protein
MIHPILEKFEMLVKIEKRTTAEVIAYLREIDQKRLYLERGYTSLFAYLTHGLGYTPSSAQRRIDGARLMSQVPEIKESLASGELNLMQVAILSQAVRQKAKEDPSVQIGTSEKKELLNLVKEKDLNETQKILSRELDLEIKALDKKRIQKDESVRLEVTLNKEQMELIGKAKELCSHTHPGASMAELIELLARNFIEKKTSGTAKMKAAHSQNPRSIPVQTKRFIFRRDQCCQWRDPVTGQKCGSKFQLQLDHKQSVWAGGTSDPDNLQLLCSIHNRHKYRKEANIQFV